MLPLKITLSRLRSRGGKQSQLYQVSEHLFWPSKRHVKSASEAYFRLSVSTVIFSLTQLRSQLQDDTEGLGWGWGQGRQAATPNYKNHQWGRTWPPSRGRRFITSLVANPPPLRGNKLNVFPPSTGRGVQETEQEIMSWYPSSNDLRSQVKYSTLPPRPSIKCSMTLTMSAERLWNYWNQPPGGNTSKCSSTKLQISSFFIFMHD